LGWFKPQHLALFQAAVTTNIGNGATTLFWEDRWIHGSSIAENAPLIAAGVAKKIKKCRTVQQAVPSLAWVQDIEGKLSLAGILEFLKLWEILEEFQLQDRADKHVWRFSNSGLFTSKSAYRAFLHWCCTV
jgi:hypothetical protein